MPMSSMKLQAIEGRVKKLPEPVHTPSLWIDAPKMVAYIKELQKDLKERNRLIKFQHQELLVIKTAVANSPARLNILGTTNPSLERIDVT